MTDILARQRQLIGTTLEWAADDLVIGDGEFALERTDAGGVRVKVGNGVDAFSVLPYMATSAFGDGYAWDTPASWTSGATRTAPDHPIMVNCHVQFSTSSGSCIIAVDGLNVAAALNGGNGEMHQTISAIIPPNTDWTITWSDLTALNVRELRADW
jgi:hypothetical protein